MASFLALIEAVWGSKSLSLSQKKATVHCLSAQAMKGGKSLESPSNNVDLNIKGLDNYDILSMAESTANKCLDLMVSKLSLKGPATRNFGTALRAAPVRSLLKPVVLRETTLLQTLQWIAEAADAGRHLVPTMMTEALALVEHTLNADLDSHNTTMADEKNSVGPSANEDDEALSLEFYGDDGDGRSIDMSSIHTDPFNDGSCTEVPTDALDTWFADTPVKADLGFFSNYHADSLFGSCEDLAALVKLDGESSPPGGHATAGDPIQVSSSDSPTAMENVGLSGTQAITSVPMISPGHFGYRAGTTLAISSSERFLCARAIVDFDKKLSERLVNTSGMSEKQHSTHMPTNSLGHGGNRAAATTSATTSMLADSPTVVGSCGELASPFMEEGASSPPGGYSTGRDPLRTGKQLWADTVDTDHDDVLDWAPERIVPICDWQTKEKLITLNLMLMAVKGHTSEAAETKTAEIQQEIKRIHLTSGMPVPWPLLQPFHYSSVH